MARVASRITEDEVRRLIKGVLSAGLPVARVTFNGDSVNVVIDNGDIGEKVLILDGQAEEGPALIREPKP